MSSFVYKRKNRIHQSEEYPKVYSHKGDKLYVEGRIRYRSYDDPKGQRRYVTEILVENMELLNPKPAEREENAQHTAGQSATTQPSTPQPENEKQKPSATTATTADDEILPF